MGDWFQADDIVSDNLNVFSASAEELMEVFAGHDAIVYAVGPDDRYTPPAPAFEFFFDKLVTQCVKVVKAARAAGVKRAVILNSYFAYFDRQPQYNGQLSNNHAYIKSRVRQAEETIKAGKEGVMDVMILELPYIFGSMPGRMPLWKEVFRQIRHNARRILPKVRLWCT